MLTSRSLRSRILAAYVLLAAVLCFVFGAASIITFKTVEQKLVNVRLGNELERFVLRQEQGLSTDLPVGMQIYIGEAIPKGMHGLPPGFQEVTLNERYLHVLVGRINSSTVVLTDDQSQFEQFESDMFMALAATIFACLMLAVLLGRLTASRVIAPLSELASAIAGETEPGQLPSLHARDETGALARSFAQRTKQLDRFLVRERLFTGDVSHELRTPLAVILNAAELLSVKTNDNQELAPIVERIRRTTLDAAERVNALLLLSRSPAKIDSPIIALRPIVEEEMARCGLLLENSPVVMRLEHFEEVWVSGSPELVATAVGNLLRNACQFTEQGEIIVRLKPGLLEVEDTGVGIPESLREQLFERFVRGRDDTVGSGLGLAIVKRVAEYLGGEIQLETTLHGGSRFILLFPTP